MAKEIRADFSGRVLANELAKIEETRRIRLLQRYVGPDRLVKRHSEIDLKRRGSGKWRFMSGE
jgi:hypothetical protein